MKIIDILRKILAFLGFGGKAELCYISTGESLPSPMSPEEEAETVAEYARGSEEARLKLIERNLRLVVYIAKRFDNTGVDTDDLVSIGTIGLIKAVGSFKPDKNIKLATYASRCIENEILMHLRKTARTRSEVSLDEPLNVDFEGNVLLRTVAEVLLKTFPYPRELGYRTGGDEFVVFSPSVAERDTRAVCSAIKEKLSVSYGKSMVSIGCVSVDTRKISLSEAVNKADMAMYADKKSNKNS